MLNGVQGERQCSLQMGTRRCVLVRQDEVVAHGSNMTNATRNVCPATTGIRHSMRGLVMLSCICRWTWRCRVYELT